MNKAILLLLSLLIIETIQQTTVTISPNQEPLPFQQFDNDLKRSLQEQQPTPEQLEMVNRLQKQILLWTSIVLVFVLYFSVMAIIDMPNPKSSILYAKYDTTRGGNEL